MSEVKKVAIVTGANRGLGLETCRQLAKQNITVILTSRNEDKGKRAADKLQAEGLDIIYHSLDVINSPSVARLALKVEVNATQESSMRAKVEIVIRDEAGNIMKSACSTPDRFRQF